MPEHQFILYVSPFQIHQKDMNRFNQAYANVIKGSIDGLKKRDKRSSNAPSTSKATSDKSAGQQPQQQKPSTPGQKTPKVG